MNTLVNSAAKSVSFAEADMLVELQDGRAIRVPLAWFPRLANATPRQRQKVRISKSGAGMHWAALDEDISVIGLVGAGSGAVQRELGRLAESGLAVVTRVGNQKHYQANRDAPVYEELRGLVAKTVGLAGPLRTALMTLGERIRLALVFGSVAKKSDTARSDVDMLIVADDLTLEEVYAALQGVERQLARQVTPTLYTRAEFVRRRKAGNPFLAKVLAGETLPLIGKENDVAGPAR